MILPTQTIRRLKLVTPFRERFRLGGVTGGVGPAGYDVLLDQDVILRPVWNALHRVLASTQERFRMPNDVCGFVVDKSTNARRGITCQNTFIEPGWEGFLTLELTLHSLRGVTLHRGTAAAAVIFCRLEEPTEQPYGWTDKYQGQERGPQEARLVDEPIGAAMKPILSNPDDCGHWTTGVDVARAFGAGKGHRRMK